MPNTHLTKIMQIIVDLFTWLIAAYRTEEVTDRRLLVNLSEEYALPQPLAEARKEKQSLRRELHTVNVGESPLADRVGYQNGVACASNVDNNQC